MVFSAGIILVVGGLCACAPLFKRASKGLGRFLTIVGFLLGILVLVIAVDYALSLNFLSSFTQIPSPADLSSLSSPYLKYFLPAMIVLGIDRKSTRLNSTPHFNLLSRLLLDKK